MEKELAEDCQKLEIGRNRRETYGDAN